jgi:hypothetical protein
LLFTVTSINGFYPLPTLSKSGLKLVCNVNIVYRNLKFEKSQDYVQKPQRSCTLRNSASGGGGGGGVGCSKEKKKKEILP